MVEMLYDHWCGNLFCIGYDILKLEALEKLLKDAKQTAEKNKHNQQMWINYHCLTEFNTFQIELYKKLSKESRENPPKDNTPKEITLATTLAGVLDIYNQYNRKDIRLPHDCKNDELKKKQNFEDQSSIYFKANFNVMYEVYFRKIDFNVSLLILENLFYLRRELNQFLYGTYQNEEEYSIKNKYAEWYEETENTIYHLVYRTNEDWRLYLSKDREIITEKNHLGRYDGRVRKNLQIVIDFEKVKRGLFLYLERENFKISLGKLKEILTYYINYTSPLTQGAATSDSSEAPKSSEKEKQEKQLRIGNNYLKSTMYMNDHYSLQKIIDYVDAIETTNNPSVLMIERALQVIGEMTKSTGESCHVSKSTKALLQVSLSVETTKQMHKIRNFLSKSNSQALTTRTSAEYQDTQMFHNIVKDLKEMKKTFISVHEINKCILDISLVEKGLSLLEKRTKEWPRRPKTLSEIQTQYKTNKNGLFCVEKNFIQQVWEPAGLTIQLLKEIILLLENKDDMSQKVQEIKETLTCKLVNMLPSNIAKIRKTLELIDENKNNVNLLKEQLKKDRFLEKKVTLTDYPKESNINQQKQIIEKGNNSSTNQQTKDILLGLLNGINDYSIHWESIKDMLMFCISNCELFASMRPSLELLNEKLANATLINAREIIHEMENICSAQLLYEHGLNLENQSFSGIQAIYNITPKDKKKQTIENTALLFFFTSRLKSLHDLLEYPNKPNDQLIKRFKQDPQFRMELEMLLADIGNVLSKCEKEMRIMTKSTQLLTGICLGDVLDHGNPFLEMLGGFFDSQELVKAYLSKAKEIADDRQAIEALNELFQSNVDLSIIDNGDRNNMNAEQKTQYDLFRKSKHWETYKVLFVTKKT
nr:uncharacterized protein LOC110380598 [Helicoverpa armigera]XP_049708386.1 uncharacterized protein LOC110380598 [Helicoverpa armigera]